jgi:uncharacterized protein (TIGR02147 family)
MNIFEASDYKQFLRKWVTDKPGGGRGEYRRMAESLRVSTTLISQVINGDKHFSLELAHELCAFLALNEREADFFLLLVEYSRAGSHGYKARLKTRIERTRDDALALAKRVQSERDLSAAESAIMFSHWTYSAVINLIACDPHLTTELLAARLKAPVSLLVQVMDFLERAGILIRTKNTWEIGPKHFHLRKDSPLVVKHHQNWRLQGFNTMPYQNETDMFYTAPMSMSEETAEQIRRELLTTIERVNKWVVPSPSKTVRCLNVDWFAY